MSAIDRLASDAENLDTVTRTLGEPARTAAVTRPVTPDFQEASAWLHRTWRAVSHRHPTAAAHAYVMSHWNRYVWLLAHLTSVRPGMRVLEVGASILSSALRVAGAEVSVAYHELEPEWAARHREEGIEGVAVELLRDTLPWSAETFDLILCDQVLEHLPLAPDFLLQQLFHLLKPGGRVVIAVPNFASWEKRWALLRGINPQDPMDRSWIYYAHHREPVMAEVLDWVASNGGLTLKREWTDFVIPRDTRSGAFTDLRRHLHHLRRGRLAPLLHAWVPGWRDYLVVQATRRSGATYPEEKRRPPLLGSREYRGAERTDGEG